MSDTKYIFLRKICYKLIKCLNPNTEKSVKEFLNLCLG